MQVQDRPGESVPRVLMLIDGRLAECADGRVLPVENPANRRIIAKVPRAGADEVEVTVQAAARAFEKWKLVPPR